jgi:glycosyltransferase involved in cell wall biosynthesis
LWLVTQGSKSRRASMTKGLVPSPSLGAGTDRNASLRIGISLLAFLPGVSGGIELYIRNLLGALERIDKVNDYYLLTNRDNHDVFKTEQHNFHLVRMNVGAHPRSTRVFWEQSRVPFVAHRLRLDVLHSPSYTYPIFSAVPGVVTICDMLYRAYPETIDKTKLAFWRVFVPLSARRCRRVLTISESSRQDIVELLHISPEKVIATPLALDRRLAETPQPSMPEVARVCQKYRIQAPYVLNVGGVGRHKNALSSVRALAELRGRPTTASLSLVITGNDYGAKSEILEEAARLRIQEAIRLPGYVAEEDLPALYTGAVAYVSTSLFEGFGLTLLEAMAFGAPVVTSNRSSLPEVAGNAASIVDPENTGQVADAIYAVASNPSEREKMVRRGYRRLAGFSWERSAEATLAAYYDAASSRVRIPRGMSHDL